MSILCPVQKTIQLPGLCPWTPAGALPQTPVTRSRSSASHASPHGFQLQITPWPLTLILQWIFYIGMLQLGGIYYPLRISGSRAHRDKTSTAILKFSGSVSSTVSNTTSPEVALYRKSILRRSKFESFIYRVEQKFRDPRIPCGEDRVPLWSRGCRSWC